MKPVAVITGVSSGVGYDLALDLLAKDWIVYGISRNEIKWPYSSLDKFETFKHIRADLSSPEVFDKLDGVGVDLLVNNAGVFSNKEFALESTETICNLIDINVRGTMLITSGLIKNMKAGSRIIFINSVAGLEEIENQAVYCASKAALTAFAGVLGKELRPKKIKVTSIHPGGINTPLWNDFNPYPPGDLNRALKTEDITNIVDYILNMPGNIELKTIKLFPDNEWH